MEPVKTTSTQRVVDFVGEVKEELNRISWTSAEELKFCVKIVVGATFAFGLGIYGIDLAIQMALRGLKLIIHAIIG